MFVNEVLWIYSYLDEYSYAWRYNSFWFAGVFASPSLSSELNLSYTNFYVTFDHVYKIILIGFP